MVPHPLDPLSKDEVHAAYRAAAGTVDQQHWTDGVRCNVVTLIEPPKRQWKEFEEGGAFPARMAEVILQVPSTTDVFRFLVKLFTSGDDAEVVDVEKLEHVQPLATPDDCALAEEIVKNDDYVQEMIKNRYGIEDMDLVACDPWSVHHCGDKRLTEWRKDGQPARLIQTFLYLRSDADDNHYAHPVDMVPVVDLNMRCVTNVFMHEEPPQIPSESVNYHRNKLASNSYLQTMWRESIKKLQITQPDGPSFTLRGNQVTWEGWTMRVGFNYREGLVIYEANFMGREVLDRASLVEMAVPYGDTNEPFQRKCAFDVGDYGLGYCANSLALGCDCLGHVHYFDAVMANSKGEPYTLKNAVCMHEEDDGLMWKHMEYRNNHSEARRSRRLVLSFIATVVNYEYLFYWYFGQDGSIDFEIKLSGELSTNLLSERERVSGKPECGTMVAPGVNSQYHQHCFCARIDVSIDGNENSVEEVDVLPLPEDSKNPYGNGFYAKKTTFKTEQEAQRVADASKARTWQIINPNKINRIADLPVAYKLMPFTKGMAGPTLLTGPNSAVTKKGQFATKHLWVTPYHEEERWPAGEFPMQSTGGEGLPKWTAANRSIENTDIVLWHSFAVTHVPRVEDFPVMPCEFTGFTLKPFNFLEGNPTIDIPPTVESTSVQACSNGCGH